MRTLVISAWSRPHEVDRGGSCWCRPHDCGDHIHHRDVDLTNTGRMYMAAYSEQRAR